MISPEDRVNEKLKETESIIDEVEKELDQYDIPSYVKDLQLKSFEKRLNEIQKEKEEINHLHNKEEMTVTMRPNNLPSGEVSLRDFTLILGGLQELSDSIANTIFNQPSEKGKIPNEILEKNQMILRETKAGSFKAIIDIRHPQQTEIGEPETLQTIKELFRLFDSSNDEELLAERVSILGPRALKNYVEWTKAISEINTPVDIEWKSSYVENSLTTFNKERAEKVYKTLNNFSSAKEEDITMQGTLTGANIRTETFELISIDGERINGRISKDAISDFKNPNFGQSYNMELLKVKIIGPGYKEKVSWTLKKMLSLD